MARELYRLLLALVRLRKCAHYPSRSAVFWAFARLRLRAGWLNLTGQRATSENVLGFNVEFFDYASFSYLFEEIFVFGTYSFKSAHPRPVIVDAGSNIGISVLFLKWLYPDAKILAFEPDPEAFKKLTRNVANNHLTNVELYNVALAKESGSAALHVEQNGSLSASLLKERQPSAWTLPRQVTTTPLSQFLLGDIDFLKMDIEGFEVEALSEVAQSGRFCRVRELVIECHHNLPGHEGLLGEIIPLLQKEGFNFQIRTVTATDFGAFGSPQDVVLHGYRRDASNTKEGNACPAP